jgi:serine/threonine protein kinase
MGCIKTKFLYKKKNTITKYHPLIELTELSNRGNIFFCKNKKYFLKRIKSKNSKELKHLKKCNNKYIISIIEILETSPTIFYIVMPRYQFDLLELINNPIKNQLNYKSLIKIYLQIINALQHCHSKRIVHLDIKMENIMVKSLNPVKIKLIDFGLSRYIPESLDRISLKKAVGTEKYKAPEIYRLFCTFQSDIYSLGSLIKFSTQFLNSQFMHNSLNIKNGVLKQCFSNDWENRPSLKELTFFLKNKNI